MSDSAGTTGRGYRLVFSGELAPGIGREQALLRLGKLFNRPTTELEPLLGGGLHVLKVADDAAALEPFRAALASAGALARIEATQPAPAAAPPAAVPQPGAAQQAAPAPRAAATAIPAAGQRHSLSEFLRRTRPDGADRGTFDLEGDRFLEVNLDGAVWIKSGAMVAYTGDIRFSREAVLQHGLKKLLKRSISGEGARLTRASGIGALYLADCGKKITVLDLDGDALVVNGNDLLAFETSVEWDIKLMKSVSAMVSGGLFNVRLQGRGMVAITTHHDPLTLEVRHAYPVHSDPNATVAWSASLEPTLKADVSVRTFLGRGSGDSFQMVFEGEGFVVVQPHEEGSLKR
jgi:uncharacterized protein (AIM24 family)